MKEFATSNDGHCMPVLQRMIGFYYYDRGQLDSAISAQTTCAKMYKALNEPIGVASAYGNISNVHAIMGNHKLALKYDRDGLGIYNSLNYTLGIVHAEAAIAESWYQLENLDSAIYYSKKSIDLRLKNQYYDGLTSIYALLAFTYSEKNDKIQAKVFAQKAEEALVFEKDEDDKAAEFSRIGQLYGEVKNMEKCFYWLRKSIAQNKKMGDKMRIQDAYDNISYYFNEAKQYDSAMHYMTLLNELKEEINSDKFQAALAKEAINADNQKREFELQEAKLVKERSQLISVIFGIVAVAGVLSILLLLRNNTIKKRALEKELALQNANAMIKGQDAERARVAQELHDRVGSMISAAKNQFEVALAAQQLSGTEDASAAMTLLDQTNDEVRLISHNLHNGAVLKQGLDTALRNHCAKIGETAKFRLRYHSTGQEIPLPQEVQMDLYRITQELLNNAGKYANAQEVSIQVSINEDNIVYSYEDDGLGFDKAKLVEKPGIGYQNLETRVKRMLATWHLDTSPGNGTTVIIVIPRT